MFSRPLLLHYYITNRCNCRCVFCDICQRAPQPDARLSDVLQNLHMARQFGIRFVDFTGGEPLLHDELPEMLHYAKASGLLTSITTNGLLYPKNARYLVGLVDFLHFSLDALDAKLNDILRGRKTFHAVMQGIDVARELGETPDLLFTVTDRNYQQIDPLSKFARKLGLMLIVNPVFSHTSFFSLDQSIIETLERYSSFPYVYINKAFFRLRKQGGNHIRSPRCRVVDSTIVISPDNAILLPCYFFSKHQIQPDSSVDNQEQKYHSSESSAPSPVHCKNRFKEQRRTELWRNQRRLQGKFSFCQHCVINCYFDPSFVYKMDEYFWLSAVAKSRYWWTKKVRRIRDRRRLDQRPAPEIAEEIVRESKK